jgi:PHD/YefM family antitoxin component YafN of YafNO toxin-antitoxin module
MIWITEDQLTGKQAIKKDNKEFVVVELKELNSLTETAHLLNNKNNAHHLQSSLEELTNKQTVTIDLAEL